jgi:voltage-gated potassium channel
MILEARPDPRYRIAVGIGILVALIAFGTTGYMLIEGWSFLDALFMTATTITTVGYREVHPLDTSGRVFTMVLLLFGVGTAFYLLTTFVSIVVEGDLRQVLGKTRMKSRIGQLRDHHILCGFGRVGEEIAREFAERDMHFVVVENNEEAVRRCAEAGYLMIQGDAAQDDVLIEAGVARARSLLAASDSDSGNTYITLTAKALNPALFVVARAGKRESEPRVRRAGADRVISPYTLSGRRMALSAIQPNIVDFIDTLAVQRDGGRMLAEIEVDGESQLLGQFVRHVVESTAVTVLGIQRADGELIVGPREDVRLEEGDRVMVVGREDEVARVWNVDTR